ncbi:hypothetical protein TNIN_306241 [Trichonephila inaurata madagascariensis]|uniref:Uncharacterized protein n=1 Tax=Trichonephila inaurata madagascariensis TaxID=2747483 RepID=A0A8X7BTG4_9ARAC|nr:hypothetical protein TNIN_306241 [Trichonephila inaurata madagascariensis]
MKMGIFAHGWRNRSPDLSPIELVRNVLCRVTASHYFSLRAIPELKATLLQEYPQWRLGDLNSERSIKTLPILQSLERADEKINRKQKDSSTEIPIRRCAELGDEESLKQKRSLNFDSLCLGNQRAIKYLRLPVEKIKQVRFQLGSYRDRLVFVMKRVK